MLSHRESKHAIVTSISGTLLDDQVLGVNVEAVTGLDGDHDHDEEADPLHDEDTEVDHSLIHCHWSLKFIHIAAYLTLE